MICNNAEWEKHMTQKENGYHFKDGIYAGG